MRLTSTFTKRRADRQDLYRRETRLAIVTAVNDDGTYDVRLPTSNTSICKVVNGSRVQFAVGNTVILQRIGGHRLMYQILATVADAAPHLSQYVEEWYDDDWLIGQLSQAIEGYDSLSDALLSKVDKAGDTMWGPLSAPELEVVDGVLYLGEGGAQAWGDGHLRLSDPISGWKTLSELGASGRVSVGSAFPGDAVDGDGCLRTDIADGIFFWRRSGIWIPEARALWQAQLTLDRVLRGRAQAGSATPTTLTLKRRNAGDNKGCFDETGGNWTEGANYIEATGIAAALRIHAYTSGGDVVMYQHADHVSTPGDYYACPMLLDGGAHGTWDQGSACYTFSGVPAGVHKFEIESDGDAGDKVCFADIVLPQYPYQDVAVPGDIGEVVAPLPTLVTTMGIGRTHDGAQCPHLGCGEGILHRLPGGSGITDQIPTRASVAVAGLTFPAAFAMTGLVRNQWELGGYYHGTVELQPPPMVGDTIKVSSTAGARGHLLDNDGTISKRGIVLPQTVASVKWCVAWSALVRITTPGSGSAFQEGDLALCIITHQRTTASAGPYMVFTNSTARAVALFKLESL